MHYQVFAMAMFGLVVGIGLYFVSVTLYCGIWLVLILDRVVEKFGFGSHGKSFSVTFSYIPAQQDVTTEKYESVMAEMERKEAEETSKPVKLIENLIKKIHKPKSKRLVKSSSGPARKAASNGRPGSAGGSSTDKGTGKGTGHKHTQSRDAVEMTRKPSLPPAAAHDRPVRTETWAEMGALADPFSDSETKECDDDGEGLDAGMHEMDGAGGAVAPPVVVESAVDQPLVAASSPLSTVTTAAAAGAVPQKAPTLVSSPASTAGAGAAAASPAEVSGYISGTPYGIMEQMFLMNGIDRWWIGSHSLNKKTKEISLNFSVSASGAQCLGLVEQLEQDSRVVACVYKNL